MASHAVLPRVEHRNGARERADQVAQQLLVLGQMVRRQRDRQMFRGPQLGQPFQRVGRFDQVAAVVLDGDGAALMKLGTLATIGAYAPQNLIHIVFDNGAYESTGGQPTVSQSVDFAAAAIACGYPQAFSSVGGLLVSGAYFLIVTNAEALPAIQGDHEPWRYTLMSGVIPALPLIVIRPFLPESPTWAEKKAAGTLGLPSVFELFRPRFRRTTIVTTVMFACAYGAAFGALQQAPRIVPGLVEITTLAPIQQEQAVGTVQFLQEMGGLTGRLLLAFFAVRVVARRRLLRLFQVPGLLFVPPVFLFATTTSLPVLQFGLFIAGVCTVAQFSFWGNYLPRMYPTHLRGTGESFAANIGGRMIGTSFAMVTTQLTNVMPGGTPTEQLAYAAAVVGLFVYVVGFTASFWLPEPEGSALPE